MDQTNNGGMKENAWEAESGVDVEKIRSMAFDAVKNADVYVQRGRELVARHPVYAVAGAVAAGFLFAKLVARKR